jgi:hypothetical protein
VDRDTLRFKEGAKAGSQPRDGHSQAIGQRAEGADEDGAVGY